MGPVYEPEKGEWGKERGGYNGLSGAWEMSKAGGGMKVQRGGSSTALPADPS